MNRLPSLCVVGAVLLAPFSCLATWVAGGDDARSAIEVSGRGLSLKNIGTQCYNPGSTTECGRCDIETIGPQCSSSYDALGQQLVNCPGMCGDGLALTIACGMQCFYGGITLYNWCAMNVLLQVGDCVGTISEDAMTSTLQGDLGIASWCVPAGCEGRISAPEATAQQPQQVASGQGSGDGGPLPVGAQDEEEEAADLPGKSDEDGRSEPQSSGSGISTSWAYAPLIVTGLAGWALVPSS